MQQSPPLAIFLSPHFDDIALSCGGTAARLARMGARCIALTVFTAPGPEGAPLSPFARKLHTDWEQSSGTTVKAINEVRRDEERAVMRLLGLEPVWLDLPDAPYRQGVDNSYLYDSDPALFGPDARVASEERRKVAPWIVEQISRIANESGVRGSVRVFAPLGVGRHVDHQLVFLAARRLGPRFGVLYFEDYPYVARPGALEARIVELATPMQARLTPITDLIGIKIAAIARYKSQLDVLFGSADDMPQAVSAYSQSVAAEAPMIQYAERMWQMRASYRLG